MPEVTINGPAGRLEGRYTHNKTINAPIALILHPHPLHGGTMNNRVVYTLFQSFVQSGFSTLRINFRGVGRSQGKYDRGEGELNDAATAVDWLQTYNPQASAIWIAGFSFGAWIGMQLLMRRPEFDGFVVVSPPANMYDFTFLAPCPSSGMIIQGDKDETVSEPAVAKLAEKIAKQRGLAIDYKVVPGANHFFQDQQDIISGYVTDYLRKSTSARLDHVAE
jgi:alpha/beta superfamily hydrolase